MDEKITIDKDTLKAIASDTRLNILKQLDKKKYTLSDLSKSLKLSGPTIKEHLDVLSKAGLVRKEASLRKWKYYSLTLKGKGILRPNETKLFLTLLICVVVGLGLLVMLGLFANLGSATGKGSTQLNSVDMMVTSAENSTLVARDSTNVTTEAVVVTGMTDQNITKPIKKPLFNSNYLILTILILIIFLVFVWFINEKQKYK